MTGSQREGLIDRRAVADARPRPGSPLAILALILAAWVTGRVVLWESPFPATQMIEQAGGMLAQAGPGPAPDAQGALGSRMPAQLLLEDSDIMAVGASTGWRKAPEAMLRGDRVAAGAPFDYRTAWRASGHETLRRMAFSARQPQLERAALNQASRPVFPGSPVFTDADQTGRAERQGSRWSLDSWAFLREGSGSAPISQGRVPVYGASQIGAIARYRAAPSSGNDPQLYLRAYRALIDPAESELAAGVSARPLAGVPVRLAAEMRAVDDRFRSELRPAAYAITEIAPVALPLGLTGEVYAGAGYVGGAADTGFIDAQAALTRQVASFDLNRADDLRLSLGAGAWGGAQRDAERLDVGPTMRLDLALGPVPARLSIDYRERVGGDAFPPSGLAATLSTRF